MSSRATSPPNSTSITSPPTPSATACASDQGRDPALVAPRSLILFVGIQGAGKSTFHRQRFASTHALASMDLYPRSARNRRRRLLRDVEALLASGRDVVVDNTHPTAAERAPLIALARAAGARVECFFFDVPVDDCLRRNAARPGDARVPDVGLLGTLKRLERPSLAEGFDALWTVSLDEARGFSVALAAG